jgi:hypothetical protein
MVLGFAASNESKRQLSKIIVMKLFPLVASTLVPKNVLLDLYFAGSVAEQTEPLATEETPPRIDKFDRSAAFTSRCRLTQVAKCDLAKVGWRCSVHALVGRARLQQGRSQHEYPAHRVVDCPLDVLAARDVKGLNVEALGSADERSGQVMGERGLIRDE